QQPETRAQAVEDPCVAGVERQGVDQAEWAHLFGGHLRGCTGRRLGVPPRTGADSAAGVAVTAVTAVSVADGLRGSLQRLKLVAHHAIGVLNRGDDLVASVLP